MDTDNISKIYTADVKLNETDKNYKKMIIIENNAGVLFIQKDLCVMSFYPNQAVSVIVKNKFSIVNVEL